MSQEKTTQCKALFTSILTECKAKNTGVLCLSEANFTVLAELNTRMPTAVLSCKALVLQLMEYKKAALVQAEKQPVQELITKILFTFMSFQDSAEQKALLDTLTPSFPKGQDTQWDKLLLSLQNMTATELPSSQNVQVVSTLASGYQIFIQLLLKFKAQAPLLPFNETLIVSLLIAGAEKVQTYVRTSVKKDQEGALSFTDEEKIKTFIQQKFDAVSSVLLLDIYARTHTRSLSRGPLIELQKKSFPLVEKLTALKERLEVKLNADLKILERVDDVAEYENFSAQFTSLQTKLLALSEKHKAVEAETHHCLQDPELLKNGEVISSIKQKLVSIEQEYESLTETIETYQQILHQRIEALRAEKQKEYQELTRCFQAFNRTSSQSLCQIMAVKFAFNRAKEEKLIPLTQEEDPSYAEKMTSIAQKFGVIEQQIEQVKAFQTQQSKLVDSKTSETEFAKRPLVEQYQIYAEFTKAFDALKKTFNESPFVLSKPMGELNEIKKSFEDRIKTSEKSLGKNQAKLDRLMNERVTLNEEKASLEDAIIKIFDSKLGGTISASEAFAAVDNKIIHIREMQTTLTESHPRLVQQLKKSYEALSRDIQVHLKELDRNFHPILKELASIIVWLFWKENLPADSWLVELKTFSDNQEKLKEEIDSEGSLKRYLSGDLDSISNQEQKKEIFKKTQQMLNQGEVSQLEHTQNVVSVIKELLDNEKEQENNDSRLKWLEPTQSSANESKKKLSANSESCQKFEQIIKNEQRKLDDLKKIDSQFFILTQSWKALARQLTTGDIKQLTDFLTAIDSVSPPSNIVMDLLRRAVEFGTPDHVKCLVEKYPSYLNMPLIKKEKQQGILLFSYERMKNRDSNDHHAVYIFHDLFKRDNININTLLDVLVANNDRIVINQILWEKKAERHEITKYLEKKEYVVEGGESIVPSQPQPQSTTSSSSFDRIWTSVPSSSSDKDSLAATQNTVSSSNFSL